MNFLRSKIEFSYNPQKLVLFYLTPSNIELYFILLETVVLLVKEAYLEAILKIKYACPHKTRIANAEFIAMLVLSQLRLVI